MCVCVCVYVCVCGYVCLAYMCMCVYVCLVLYVSFFRCHFHKETNNLVNSTYARVNNTFVMSDDKWTLNLNL